MFKKLSHNRLAKRLNVVRSTKNKVLFNVSAPLFQDRFLKRGFFDSFNGRLYRQKRDLAEKKPKVESGFRG
jgi:hypothetical protein